MISHHVHIVEVGSHLELALLGASCEGISDLLNSYLWSLNPVEGGYFLKQLPYEKGVLFHPSGI